MKFLPIRLARPEDLSALCSIAEEARAFLKEQGVDQWQGSYPDRAAFAADIENGQCFVLPDEQNIPVGTLTLCAGAESAYAVLASGCWLTDTPDAYLTIHRMAVAARARGSGAGGLLLAFAEQKAQAGGLLGLRTDTHAENKPMQTALTRAGLQRCGVVVYGPEVEGGCLRAAYEKKL